MNEEEVLKWIRVWCKEQLKHVMTYDTMPHTLIQTYLLLQIMERLECIDTSLTSMSNDSWNDHHNH